MTPVREDLTVCPECSGRLVYPLTWRDLDPGGWWLELRCPECETVRETECEHETIERFDHALNARTDALITDLERIESQHMAEDIERFVAALDADAILPCDFGWPTTDRGAR